MAITPISPFNMPAGVAVGMGPMLQSILAQANAGPRMAPQEVIPDENPATTQQPNDPVRAAAQSSGGFSLQGLIQGLHDGWNVANGREPYFYNRRMAAQQAAQQEAALTAWMQDRTAGFPALIKAFGAERADEMQNSATDRKMAGLEAERERNTAAQELRDSQAEARLEAEMLFANSAVGAADEGAYNAMRAIALRRAEAAGITDAYFPEYADRAQLEDIRRGTYDYEHQVDDERLQENVDSQVQRRNFQNANDRARTGGYLSGIANQNRNRDEATAARNRTATVAEQREARLAAARASTSNNPSAPPRIGSVVNGYSYKGGDPNDRNNWERVD